MLKAFKKYAALAAERVAQQEKQRERKETSKQKATCGQFTSWMFC